MPQTQPPVTAVTTTRNAVAPGARTSSNNGGIVYAPCVAPGGLVPSTRYKREAFRLASMGGQYRTAEGTSTKLERSALIDWFNTECRALAGIREEQAF
jgi:hypothetical protein